MKCASCGHDNIAGSDYCAECNADMRDLDMPSGASPVEKGIMNDPIGDLIPPDPLKVAPETPVRKVVHEMIERDRNCALVVDKGTMVGIFTERDVLLNMADRFDELADRPVQEFMTRDPERLRPTDPIAFGLNRMLVGGYRHVPIQRSGNALGVVSVRHIVAYLQERYPEVVHHSS